MPDLVAKRIAELEAKAEPPLSEKVRERAEARKAANQNEPTDTGDIGRPDHKTRLQKYQADHGGELRLRGNVWILFGAEIEGQKGQISIDPKGKAWLYTAASVPIEVLDTPQTLDMVCPTDWHGKPIPPRDWYIDDLVPARQVTITSGDGGVGKSLFWLQIGAAGSMAIDTLGMSPIGGRVLYLGAEDEEDEFKRRLFDIVTKHGKTLADLGEFRLISMAGMDAMLSVPDKSGLMNPTALWRRFVATSKEFLPRLIVMDTVADLFGGDEVKRIQARQFIGMLRGLAIEIDCAIVLLAHPSVQGMQSGTGRSGSTGWSNSSRSMLYITRSDREEDPNGRVLSTTKSNYGAVGGQIKFRWEDGAFVLDDGKPTPASSLLQGKAERVFREALSEINRNGDRVAKTRGTNYAPKIIAERPEGEGLSLKIMETAMANLLASGEVKVVMEGPPSKRRQRLILAAEDFGPE